MKPSRLSGQAERELRKSEQRARLAIEAARLGTWRFDLLSGTGEANGRMPEIWGASADAEITTEKALQSSNIHPEDRERVCNALAATLDPTSAGRYEIEYRIILPDQTEHWVLANGLALFEGEGPERRAVEFFGTTLDITERKQAEQLLEGARAEAEEANQAKDRFLAMLSHELRTPLNPIVGWTQLLRRGGLSPKAQADALEVIERNARLQTQLIEDLLDVSRIEQGKFELRLVPLSPESVVRTAVETVRSLAQAAGVEIEIQSEKGLPIISADPTRLSQVVWNLLTNAIKFTPAGGRVQVRLKESAGGVCIEVSDSGIGIVPEFLARLFERFSQASEGTTRIRGGLGLGLFIVQHIVAAHGGQVRVESGGEGKGTTFTVSLPLIGRSPGTDG